MCSAACRLQYLMAVINLLSTVAEHVKEHIDGGKKMANIGNGNVETYVRELLSEYLGSEAEGVGYSQKGSLADNSNVKPVLNQGSLKKTGRSEKAKK